MKPNLLQHHYLKLVSALVCLAMVACEKKSSSDTQQKPANPISAPAPAIENQSNSIQVLEDLGKTKLDLARTQLAQSDLSSALHSLHAALETEAVNDEAVDLLESIFAKTTWSIPEWSLTHSQEIEHLASDGASLWVGLKNPAVVVRWDIATASLQAVLFPSLSKSTRSVTFSPRHRFVVIERDGISLLCNASTLKPITHIGTLPDHITPSSALAFSPDEVLLLHPSHNSYTMNLLLRDSISGQVIAESILPRVNGHFPISYQLTDSLSVKIIYPDGKIRTTAPPSLSLSTVEPDASAPTLLHSKPSLSGNSMLAAFKVNALAPPSLAVVPSGATIDASFESWLISNPWTLQPCLWNGLGAYQSDPVFKVLDTRLRRSHFSDITTGTPITAIAFGVNSVWIGEKNGQVTCYRYLPKVTRNQSKTRQITNQAAQRKALNSLIRLLEDSNQPSVQRSKILKSISLDDLNSLSTSLNFNALHQALANSQCRISQPDAEAKLTQRLALFTQKPQNSIAVKLANSCLGNDNQAIEKLLAQAKLGTSPPIFVDRLVQSRLRWLKKQYADTYSLWQDQSTWPDYTMIQQTQDWEGYEHADFNSVYQLIQKDLQNHIDQHTLTEATSPADRQRISNALLQPDALKIFGRKRLADIAIRSAQVAIKEKESANVALKLAVLARQLGGEAVPSLRIEALAYNALGQHEPARQTWVSLLTNFPDKQHIPSDYAEAAYTSYENRDPEQSLAILDKGLQKFPHDADFALRAAWIALLIEKPERAYQLLLLGERIGYSEAKRENATLLFAIAAAQSGSIKNARNYIKLLIEKDSTWLLPQSLEQLEWPDRLKSTLSELLNP